MVPAETPALVPELEVSDLDLSLRIYVEVFGFTYAYGRPEERFAYLIRGGAHLMLEEMLKEGLTTGRRFHNGPLNHPFGQGMNLQIEVTDVEDIYAAVQHAGLTVVIPLEERWYRKGEEQTGNRQFVVADPDGYLLRFFGDMGVRPVPMPLA